MGAFLELDDVVQALRAKRCHRNWIARCPAHDDQNPSLSIGRAADGRLLLHCFAGCGFEEIRDALQRMDVATGPNNFIPASEDTTDAAARTARAARIWEAGRSPRGTLVERYLAGRGLSLPTEGLRFAPTLRHPSGAIGPAMVAAIRDRDGALTSVHRTWLAADGGGKAALDPSKAMLGQSKGGGAILRRNFQRVIVGEGIETALSVGEALPEFGVVAALSASGMAGYRLPRQQGELVIAADGDTAGRRAAQDLGGRVATAGWRVRIMTAPDGQDWNDVLRNASGGARNVA